jgi:predicted secreted protein
LFFNLALVSITDKNAQSLGKLTGTENIVLARKNNPNFTSWYSTLPLHGPELMQKVLQEAGAHVYSSETTDVLFSGSGLLWIHTAEGGRRTIRLKNGEKMEITLPPKSTTLYNNQTGEQIF